jgi:hypothetical protein
MVPKKRRLKKNRKKKALAWFKKKKIGLVPRKTLGNSSPSRLVLKLEP